MINLAILPFRLTFVKLNGSRNSFLYEFVEKVLIFCSRRSLKERQCFVMIAQLNFNIGTISVFFNNIYCLSLSLSLSLPISVQMQMEKIHPNPTSKVFSVDLWTLQQWWPNYSTVAASSSNRQPKSPGNSIHPTTLTCLVAVWLWTQEEKTPWSAREAAAGIEMFLSFTYALHMCLWKHSTSSSSSTSSTNTEVVKYNSLIPNSYINGS